MLSKKTQQKSMVKTQEKCILLLIVQSKTVNCHFPVDFISSSKQAQMLLQSENKMFYASPTTQPCN